MVSTNYIALSNADIEKIFLSKPFESFTKLDEAIDWAESILKQNDLDIKPNEL